MAGLRKPYEGVWNIVRFNWHFYAVSSVLILLSIVLSYYLDYSFSCIIHIACSLILAQIVISLLTSFYIYDLSELYKLIWLKGIDNAANAKFINIHAGFDETSALLHAKFPEAELSVYDFYDPQKHTEVSIKRARNAYPPFHNTRSVTTAHLPLPDKSMDTIFVILSAHEIRDAAERVVFFKELNRVLKPTGQIIIVEHLRDLPNFIAYSIGFSHFLSKASWLNTFAQSDLTLSQEIKVTPFITTFILSHGTSS